MPDIIDPTNSPVPISEPVTVYRGIRVCSNCTVLVDGSPLPIAPSLAIRRHSPTGFEWGYAGSGPAQLALALLLHATGDAELSERLYQRFKGRYVAGWRRSDWQITADEIRAWVADVEATIEGVA